MENDRQALKREFNEDFPTELSRTMPLRSIKEFGSRLPTGHGTGAPSVQLKELSDFARKGICPGGFLAQRRGASVCDRSDFGPGVVLLCDRSEESGVTPRGEREADRESGGVAERGRGES